MIPTDHHHELLQVQGLGRHRPRAGPVTLIPCSVSWVGEELVEFLACLVAPGPPDTDGYGAIF